MDNHDDFPKQESEQCGGNDLPWPRRYMLSECSCTQCNYCSNYCMTLNV